MYRWDHSTRPRERNSWCQCCNITDYPDGQEGSPDYDEEGIESIMYDVSCAAGDKGVTRTPVEALWQPMRYPRNALYRFPVRFRSIEALPDLLSYVNSQAVTPGCRLVYNGGHNGRVAINLPDLMAYITSQVVSPGYRLVSNGGGRDVYYNKLYNPVYHIIPNH